LELAFRADGLSLIFAIMISAIGGLILIYAGGYLSGDVRLGRLYAFLLLFMGSMLGLVLADNLILLFVFWELTSITSFLLIGFDHEREEARTAALQALLVTGGGGLALLAGMLLIGSIAGTFDIPSVLASGPEITAHPLYLTALLLVLAGALTKSAQFPFHFWLPSAMEAPTPVSAYLHSATMVKAGVYLLARLHPAFGDTEAWIALCIGFGAITMIAGAFLAYLKTDLKQILAYSTVSSLGMLVFALGLGPLGAQAAVVFLIAHSLYKGALFMLAGAVDHQAGSRDIVEVSGLRHTMPLTAAATLLAALSLAGVPPLFGFISKELMYEASRGFRYFAVPLLAIVIITGALTVAVAGYVAIRPFFGRPKAPNANLHEASSSLLFGPVLLAGVGFVLGLFPALLDTTIENGVEAILRERTPVKLALFHGLNLTLGLSAFTVAVGIALYLAHTRIGRLAEWAGRWARWGPAASYDAALSAVLQIGVWQTRLLQNGLLPHYLRTVLFTAGALSIYSLARYGSTFVPVVDWDVRPYELMIAAMILIGAFNSVRSPSRLAAVVSLGAVALGVSLIFVLFGAPDLAMTQFLVETLTVILLVLILYHLPSYTILSTRRQRMRDGIVAGAAGSLMTILVLAVLSTQSGPRISEFYLENSWTLAHGRNVVNVILVDFRGFDTFGEITVLAIAAVGVYSLLRLRPHGRRTG
jgi:multicomponent Na+:H+ antiporter subunit A